MYTSQGPTSSRCSTGSGQATIQTHFLGPHPLIRHYLDRLNVEDILAAHLPHGRRGTLTHAQAIGVLVYNILTSPGPLYRLENWAEPIEPGVLSLSVEQKEAINDDRVGRALDALGSPQARGIWFRLALRAIKRWELSCERIHFDTTSVTFFGEYRGSVSEPRITHGHNKDHRPDLRQLVFGLNVTSDGAVPLLHRSASGNRTDDTLQRGNFDRLRALLGTSDFIYVADSKLATTENMAHVARYGGSFVTVLPRTRAEDKEFRRRLSTGGSVRWRAVLTVPGRACEPEDVFSCPVGEEPQTREGYRLIWYRSSGKARIDESSRKRNLQKALTELDQLALKLDIPRKKASSRAEAKRRAVSICRRYGVSDFIKVTLRDRKTAVPRRLRPGRPREGDPVRLEIKHSLTLTFDTDEEALARAQKTDGVFPLVSHGLEKRGRREILEIYKYQPYLEKRFSQVKSDLAISPVFLKTPSRAAALLDVYFIAIAVSSLIERDIRKAMREAGINELPLYPEGRPTEAPTAQRVLEAFASAGWHEFRRGEEVICFPLEMSDLQKKVLDLLNIPVRDYR